MKVPMACLTVRANLSGEWLTWSRQRSTLRGDSQKGLQEGCRDIPMEAVASKSLELSHSGYIEDVQHKPGKGRVLLAGDAYVLSTIIQPSCSYLQMHGISR
jgi:hypothetical protein